MTPLHVVYLLVATCSTTTCTAQTVQLTSQFPTFQACMAAEARLPQIVSPPGMVWACISEVN